MALRPGDKYYEGLVLSFDQTVRNWVAQSSQQLRDSYRMQHVWDGTRSNSVWMGRGTHQYYKTVESKPVYSRGKDKHKVVGHKRGRVPDKKVTNYSWYDEVSHRIQMQQRYPSREYWYPTGMSYQIAMHHPVTVVEGGTSPVIDFATTLGALYAEAGVGATGGRWTGKKFKPYVRPKDIKVNRSDNWKHNVRYVRNGWRPKRGDAVRPNTRQQVSLLARRLKWAARMIYEHDLTIYLGYMLEQELFDLGSMVWVTGPDGMPRGISFKRGQLGARKTWQQFKAEHSNL